MSSDPPSVRELTRHLVGRAAPQSDAPDGALLAVHEACERTYRALARSLGPTGSQALLTRALAQSQDDHPLLKEIRIGGQSDPGLGGVMEAAQAHGAKAVTEALEAVLETLLGLLGRLIGNDMVSRLVEQNGPVGTHDDEDVK
jgi:chaperonin GroEL (HSP60 family)